MSYAEGLVKTTATELVNGWKPAIEAAAKNKQCSVYIYHYDTITAKVASRIMDDFGLNIKRISEGCSGGCDYGCTCNAKTGYIVSW